MAKYNIPIIVMVLLDFGESSTDSFNRSTRSAKSVLPPLAPMGHKRGNLETPYVDTETFTLAAYAVLCRLYTAH